jgi:phosphoglycolate phosphatase
MAGEPKLVIFDCDGTLVDSQHLIVGAMQTAFAACGLAEPADGAVRGIIGLSLPQAVGALAPEAGPRELDRLGEAYKQAFIDQRARPDFHEPLFAGAREILHRLAHRDDVLLGVATGKSRRGVDVLFEREGLGSYFHSIQTADDAPSKPHPGMIHNALLETGIAPGLALMIGDTSYDMLMAREARVGAVGVGWGYHPRQQLLAAGAHHLIEAFEEIMELVDGLAAPRS